MCHLVNKNFVDFDNKEKPCFGMPSVLYERQQEQIKMEEAIEHAEKRTNELWGVL
jgi:hypothetical protein